jgi:hypothetical protein
VEEAPFEFRPLPLVRFVENETRQVCRLSFAGKLNGGDATLVVHREGAKWQFPLDFLAESDQHEILLPEVDAPCLAQAELRIGETSQSVEVEFAPVRRWEVFLVNVRIWESAGRRSAVRLSFPSHDVLAAFRVRPTAGDLGRAEVVDGDL